MVMMRLLQDNGNHEPDLIGRKPEVRTDISRRDQCEEGKAKQSVTAPKTAADCVHSVDKRSI